MDILQAVSIGIDKSNKVSEAIQQVSQVFDEVNRDLKKFSGGELSLARETSITAGVAAIHGKLFGVERDDFEHDLLVLKLITPKAVFSHNVAGWRQRVTGFPCILKFDGQELSCASAKFLLEGLLELFSSIGFGNAVRSLLSQSLESQRSVTSHHPQSTRPVTSHPETHIIHVADSDTHSESVSRELQKEEVPTVSKRNQSDGSVQEP